MASATHLSIFPASSAFFSVSNTISLLMWSLNSVRSWLVMRSDNLCSTCIGSQWHGDDELIMHTRCTEPYVVGIRVVWLQVCGPAHGLRHRRRFVHARLGRRGSAIATATTLTHWKSSLPCCWLGMMAT